MEAVMGWACQFSSVGLLLVGAGPPCQDVSTLNVDRKGSQVVRLLKKCFPRAQVHMFMESVASMDAEDRAAMSEDVGVIPCRVDAAGVSLARRLRLYWRTWELKDEDGFVMEAAALDGSTNRSYGSAGSEGFLGARVVLASWPQACYIHYPVPGRWTAGLATCDEVTLQRWRQDSHASVPSLPVQA